jgi:hypothetical protein
MPRPIRRHRAILPANANVELLVADGAAKERRTCVAAENAEVFVPSGVRADRALLLDEGVAGCGSDAGARRGAVFEFDLGFHFWKKMVENGKKLKKLTGCGKKLVRGNFSFATPREIFSFAVDFLMKEFPVCLLRCRTESVFFIRAFFKTCKTVYAVKNQLQNEKIFSWGTKGKISVGACTKFLPHPVASHRSPIFVISSPN